VFLRFEVCVSLENRYRIKRRRLKGRHTLQEKNKKEESYWIYGMIVDKLCRDIVIK